MNKTFYKFIGFLLFVSLLFNFYLLYEFSKNRAYFEIQEGHFVSIDILNEIYIASLQLDQFSQLYIRTQDTKQLETYNNIANQVFGRSPRTTASLYHMQTRELLDILKENIPDSHYKDQLIGMYNQLVIQHECQKKAFQNFSDNRTNPDNAIKILYSAAYLDSIDYIINTYTELVNNTKHIEPTYSPINLTFIQIFSALLLILAVICSIMIARHYINISDNKASIQKYINLLVNSMPFASCIFDDSGKVIGCNTKLIELLDIPAKEEFISNFTRYFAKEQAQQAVTTFIREKNTFLQKNNIAKFKWVFLDIMENPVPCVVTAIHFHFRNKNYYIYYAFNSQKELEMQAKIKEQEERIQIMLDSTPLCCTIWDENYALIDCNQECLRFFNFAAKQDFIENFTKLIPLCQPNGQLSASAQLEKLKKAFETGHETFEWLYKNLNQELIPFHVTLERIKYKNGNVIVSYARDLREEKNIFNTLKKKQTELYEAKMRSEKEAKAKSDFLAVMSHEIRTPLNVIINVFGFLTETKLEPKYQDFVEKGISSATLLLHTINDILDYSKIEAGQLNIEHVPFTLSELSKNIFNLFTIQMQQKGLEYTIDKDPALQDSWIGDPVRIIQILSNFISNACKFTEKGSVTVKISKVSESNVYDIKIAILSFEVIDTGIGISEEQRYTIFHPFTQADSSTTRKYGGTGLGLSISKNLANLMQGQLTCTSTLGEGSAFKLEIPLEHDEKPQRSETKQTSAIDDKKLKNLSVLLVEDNAVNTIVAMELLRKKDISVDTAVNGIEAIKKASAHSYDIILMDIQMPVMDGVTATRHIRKDLQLITPIIAMTANVLEEDKKLYMESGFNAHIAKPVIPAVLYETLTKFSPL